MAKLAVGAFGLKKFMTADFTSPVKNCARLQIIHKTYGMRNSGIDTVQDELPTVKNNLLTNS